MKKAWLGLIVCVWLAMGTDTAQAWNRIKADVVEAPAGLAVGQVVDLPLDRYWRSNLHCAAEGLRDNKKDFPHVPNLIEYRVKLPTGGRYVLEGRFSAEQACPAYLTINGEPQGVVFAEPSTNGDAWTPLAEARLWPASHAIRFTSRYVETLFPVVKGLRLVLKEQADVPVPPEPEIYKPRPEPPRDWAKHITRKIHGDFHTAGFIKGVGKDFDPDEYGRTLKESGVNAIVVFAKGHQGYAYYNTKYGTRHPGLDFDLMKAQIEACHKYGITIWVYFSVGLDELYTSTQEQGPVENPDHRYEKLQVNTGNLYVRENLWPMITESVRDYDVDGVFFDYPNTEDFVQRTITLIKDIKPGVQVIYNHQWAKSHEEMKKLDVVELESWNHTMPMYHWQYYARYARGYIPLTAMTTRFWRTWGDFGGLVDEAMLRFHVATGQANGCGITIGDQMHPYGKLNPAVYERIGRVLREAARVEPYVLDSESIPYVALLRARDEKLTRGDNPSRALIDGGVHFTVVDSTQDPTPFKAIIVPDASLVDADYLPKLEGYVRQGGRLLVFGEPKGKLAELLGVRFPVEPEPAYVRVQPEVLPTPPAMDIYTYLPVQAAEPVAGAEILVPLVWSVQHGTIHHFRGQSPAHDEVSGLAAITIRRHGKGQFIYSGAPLLEVYARYGTTAMRQILTDVLGRVIAPAEQLARIEAPVSLEISLNRQAGRTIVHLVHCPVHRRSASGNDQKDYLYREPIIEGLPTVCGTKLHLADELVAGRKVRSLLDDGAEVPTTRNDDGTVTLDVPDFRIRSVLVIE